MQIVKKTLNSPTFGIYCCLSIYMTVKISYTPLFEPPSTCNRLSCSNLINLLINLFRIFWCQYKGN